MSSNAHFTTALYLLLHHCFHPFISNIEHISLLCNYVATQASVSTCTFCSKAKTEQQPGTKLHHSSIYFTSSLCGRVCREEFGTIYLTISTNSAQVQSSTDKVLWRVWNLGWAAEGLEQRCCWQEADKEWTSAQRKHYLITKTVFVCLTASVC